MAARLAIMATLTINSMRVEPAVFARMVLGILPPGKLLQKVDPMMLQISRPQSYWPLATLLTGWFILLSLFMIYPGLLAAHTALMRTMPAAEAVLVQPPREVRFWFNEPIERHFSRIEVFRAVLEPGTDAIQPRRPSTICMPS